MLPKIKSITVITAAEQYEKTWRTYTSLPPFGKESLSKYCKSLKVHYRGLLDWMCERSVGVPKSKQLNEVISLPPVAPVT